MGKDFMKEYKFVKASEGLKAIQIGNATTLEENCNILVEKYSLEGWKVYQFTFAALGEIVQIIFERDKQ